MKTTLPASSMTACECGNCGHVCSIDDLQPIQDYFERVADDEPEPAGECPLCGCLSHQIDPEQFFNEGAREQ